MAGENDERLTTDAAVETSEQAVEESDAKLEILEGQAEQADAEQADAGQADAEQEASIPAEAEADAKPEAVEETPAPAKAEEPVADDVDPEDKPEGIGNIIAIAIIALIFGLVLCLPAFLGSTGSASSKAGYDTSGGVAASYNNIEIGENDVTDFILNFRRTEGLEDDASWGEWMVSFGYTPESLRSDTVNYFIQKEMVTQAAKEQGVEVTDADIDKRYAQYAEQVGGEDVLKGYLEKDGVTVEAYKESLALGLLQEALANKVVTDVQPADDATILEVLKIYYYDEVPADATTLDGIDENLVNQVRELVEGSMKEEAFSKWLDDYKSKATIVINDMPKGLPYDIDLKPYEGAADNLMALEDEILLDEEGDTELALDEEGEEDLELDSESAQSASASAQSADASEKSSAASEKSANK